MVNYTQSLDTTFGALADPIRRAILSRLAQGPAQVTELAAPFSVSLPAISKHLRILETRGLIAREKQGRVHRCRLVASPMKEASDWISHYRRFWTEQLDSLEKYLEQQQKEESDDEFDPSIPDHATDQTNLPGTPG